jgi:hypothetical protein
MAVNRPDPVRNLGHRATDASLTKNPAGRMVDYTSGEQGKRIARGPARSVGVYGSFKNPTSGISSEQNLSRWSGYASANTEVTRGQAHGPGPGREPPQSDGQRQHVPAAAREKDSDGYLESTKNWPSFDTGGADSGVGRLDKSRKY